VTPTGRTSTDELERFRSGPGEGDCGRGSPGRLRERVACVVVPNTRRTKGQQIRSFAQIEEHSQSEQNPLCQAVRLCRWWTERFLERHLQSQTTRVVDILQRLRSRGLRSRKGRGTTIRLARDIVATNRERRGCRSEPPPGSIELVSTVSCNRRLATPSIGGGDLFAEVWISRLADWDI